MAIQIFNLVYRACELCSLVTELTELRRALRLLELSIKPFSVLVAEKA